jgi:hypothetical protein
MWRLLLLQRPSATEVSGIKAEAFLRRLRRIVPGEMAVLKSADPAPYRKIISGQKDFVEILFFGLEKGRCNCDRIWTQGYGVQNN